MTHIPLLPWDVARASTGRTRWQVVIPGTSMPKQVLRLGNGSIIGRVDLSGVTGPDQGQVKIGWNKQMQMGQIFGTGCND